MHSDQDADARDAKRVSKDICQWLKQSYGFPVDFEIESNGLWHLAPRWAENPDHYTTMASLQQLLKDDEQSTVDDVEIARLNYYSPKEKLILCYILANSMLFLYPGSWLHTTWDSKKLYFIRRTGNRTSKPIELAFPYLSVDVQDVSDATSVSREHMQCHPHPNILALGIVFLEIATGSAFNRSISTDAWQRCNDDFLNAQRHIRGKEKWQMSSTLHKVIISCIELKSPSHMSSNNLAQEGPIRQYLLSCIIFPLAFELRNGYEVNLEELNNSLEKELKNPPNVGELHAFTSSSAFPRTSTCGLVTIPESALILSLSRRVVMLTFDCQLMPHQHQKMRLSGTQVYVSCQIVVMKR